MRGCLFLTQRNLMAPETNSVQQNATSSPFSIPRRTEGAFPGYVTKANLGEASEILFSTGEGLGKDLSSSSMLLVLF